MEIRTSTFKIKSGRLKGHWRVKLKYRDEFGQLVVGQQKTYKTRSEAIDKRPKLEADFKSTHGQIVTGSRMSFADLAEKCKVTIYKKAVILDGRKTDGVKSFKTTHGFINTLTGYFGNKRLTQISTNDLKAYKKWRFELGSRRGNSEETKPISLTTINRELATMRRMMKLAFAEGWVTRDIFLGAKVIDTGAELERSRTLSDAEEALLIACCHGKHEVEYKRNLRGKQRTDKMTIERDNPYLKAIILLALDSAMRQGEILKLRWQDIDLDTGLIRVIGTHTKTERERLVPLSERVESELRELPSFASEGVVFPITDFKRSWTTTKRLAGISDLHFHDLRRTAITRMNLRNVPLAVAGKIAGHARLETTVKHYVATDMAIVQDVAARINMANAERNQINTSDLIN